MVRTNSMVLELGFQLPNFEMLNANSPNNQYFNSHNLDNRHLLLMFICAHCPFVKYLDYKHNHRDGVFHIYMMKIKILLRN